MTPSFFIELGVLVIPVKSYPAARDERVPLANLHQPCQARLSSLSSCTGCGKVLPHGSPEIVKGYEVGKGQYAIVTTAEIEALEAAGSKTMAVKAFVPMKDVDPVFFGKANHLGPADPAGIKGFALLREAMLRTERAAVVQYVQSSREKIGLIRALEPEGLMLHDLFYPNEVRAYAEQKWGGRTDAEFQKRELDLAAQLVAASEEPFDLSGFTDGYQGRLNELVQARVAGLPLPKLEPAKQPGHVVDLMAALEQSLAAKKQSRAVAATKGDGVAIGKLKKPAKKSA